MKIDSIIEKIKKEHELNSPAQVALLEIIKENLHVVSESKKELIRYKKLEKNAYGLYMSHKILIQHPSLKIKNEAEKIIMSCMRMFDIKTSKSKPKQAKSLQDLLNLN